MADSPDAKLTTTILPVDARKIGRVHAVPQPDDLLDSLALDLDDDTPDTANLRHAAARLRTSDVPVAFPTETVYGLGADATRSEAVTGIYRAKGRPADNPLIVHFASLAQLRAVLRPAGAMSRNGGGPTHGHGVTEGEHEDPIPAIYHPLIRRFWPGPLTILLPNPASSPLAPEVTAGLPTFGARIPAHVLALALIQLAGVPVAAPSANASTRPSPTAAEHVLADLEGKVEWVVEGGMCDVGVESTVVDGLCDPPVVLRPGGVGVEALRECEGWTGVGVGYGVEEGDGVPRAPGMKYRHYAPRARVVLFEVGAAVPTVENMQTYRGDRGRIGLIRTRTWTLEGVRIENGESSILSQTPHDAQPRGRNAQSDGKDKPTGFAGLLATLDATAEPQKAITTHAITSLDHGFELLDLALGPDTAGIARGIFAALRELDQRGVDAILVEGIDEMEGQTAAAIMNRLRKAAEVRVGG
ncbi:hypothetical protein LTR53_006189 [Teratosphaeriaceae sp. CCFEE 6253]|nr:hypothetical protein LTR53_006189 [Teratosphaeriaceae sp. CCFEE 6253]